MLDKINKKKNINVLLCVQKHDVINTNNLHIVTQQWTKIGNDNPRIRKIKEKNDYLNSTKQKQLYNNAPNMFREFARQEEIKDMKSVDTSVGSTTIVEDMEVEDDFLEIATIDHVGPSNALHATKKATTT